jgi:hypothetical protein
MNLARVATVLWPCCRQAPDCCGLQVSDLSERCQHLELHAAALLRKVEQLDAAGEAARAEVRHSRELALLRCFCTGPTALAMLLAALL